MKHPGEVFAREEMLNMTYCAMLCLDKPPCVAFNFKGGMDCELLAGDSAEARLQPDATTVHAGNGSFKYLVS